MQLRRFAVGLGLAIAAAGIAVGLTESRSFETIFGQLEEQTLDWRIRTAGRFESDNGQANPRAQASDVRLILFDSTATRDWPYEQPYPRAVLANLIDVASSLGAKAIGLDVFLELRQTPEQALLDSMHSGRSGDRLLHDAIERAGNVVLAAPTVESNGERVLSRPDPYFASVAAAVGAADLPTAYETIREAALTVATDSGRVPGFALAVYAVAKGLDPDALVARAVDEGTLDVPGLPPRYARVSADERVQGMPVLFVGPPSQPGQQTGAFQAFSSADIAALGDFAPEEWFRDRILMLGTGFHDSDKFRTPFYDEPNPAGGIYGWTYGIEVHANALENLLTGEHPTPLGGTRTALLYLLIALGVSLMTFWRDVYWGGATLIALVGGVGAMAWLLFDRSHAYLHVPLVGTVLSGGLSYVVALGYVSVIEGQAARETRRQFKKYLNPQIVDQLARDPSRLKLGGEKRQVTIIFTDLAGFTSMSEYLDPEVLLSLLNDYLDEMADIVLEEGGTLDKYIGDAIMAFYGAPIEMPDHALRCCRTALRMQRRLTELNVVWRESGRPSLKMRVGINTGSPVIGNIGGDNHFSYTALGDAVNLAARLEPACKTYGVSTMIAHTTRMAAGDGIIARELELLAVYGKARPVPVYELVALAGEELGERAELLELYEKGLSAYRRRDFELALQYFDSALEVDPQDGPSRMYVERSREYIENPPPVDWDFVERRQVK